MIKNRKHIIVDRNTNSYISPEQLDD